MGGIRSRLLGVAVGAGLLAGSTGCFSPPPEARARLAQVQRQGQELDVAVDALEERFLGNQAKVLLWSELRERHKQVSAVVVRNHGYHETEMARLYDAQREKALRLSGSMASASPFLSGASAASKRTGLNAR